MINITYRVTTVKTLTFVIRSNSSHPVNAIKRQFGALFCRYIPRLGFHDDQAFVHGVFDQFGTIVYVELLHYLGAMPERGLKTDGK